MLFHLFILFSHMNWSIHSYSAGKLTIRMIHVRAHCNTMSLIGKHARISENLGPPHALHVDRHFLVQFDMTDFS